MCQLALPNVSVLTECVSFNSMCQPLLNVSVLTKCVSFNSMCQSLPSVSVLTMFLNSSEVTFDHIL